MYVLLICLVLMLVVMLIAMTSPVLLLFSESKGSRLMLLICRMLHYLQWVIGLRMHSVWWVINFICFRGTISRLWILPQKLYILLIYLPH
ncbi:hypothetical protein ACS0TY_016169 [Phlomoides rotata]